MRKIKLSKNQKLNKVIFLALGLILVALFLQMEILNWINNKNTAKTSEVLVDRVVNVIEKNEENEKDMIASLKEDYIVRARAVAYIIDAKPEAEENVEELKKIAELMSVDEIHIFDSTGTIYSGTIPEYYGYNFDSGEQMEYFKPMLKDKTLTMCQDVTPNTSEGRQMMYAIVWNDAGTRMVQIGIEPVRLLNELKQNEIPAIVANMPVYDGLRIYVADKKSGLIYGATDSSDIGKRLDDIGIAKKGDQENQMFSGINRINGENYRCTFYVTEKYAVGVICPNSTNTESNIIALLIVGVYLSLAATGIIYMFVKVSKAKIDELTGCPNRKAYKDDMTGISLASEFVYATLDVNGLKSVNDNQGHAAGDELIRGAAECMKQCFGSYGKVYRIGGDEFAAVLFVNEEKIKEIFADFEDVVSHWSGNRVHSLAISCGYVYSREKAWESFQEIFNTADNRMYEEKAKYYSVKGRDRRRR